MTNEVAIGLGIVIAAAIGIDVVAFDGAGSLILARRFADLLQWAAFWR